MVMGMPGHNRKYKNDATSAISNIFMGDSLI